jgi:hypothetical protein
MAQGLVPMRTLLRQAGSVVLAAAAACQTPHYGYADLVNRSLPASDVERHQECEWIRSEQARQQSFGQAGSGVATTPIEALQYQSMARENVDYLQSRYLQTKCVVLPDVAPTAPVLRMPPRSSSSNVFPGVDPTVPVLRMPPQSSSGMTGEECFKQCRQLTSQTGAQCFAQCRH